MAETVVSLAGQHVLPKIWEAFKMLRDLPNEAAELVDELESFHEFINDADKVAEAEKDNNKRDRIRKRVMRLREAAFRMEDLMDEYMIGEEKQPDDPRCAVLLCEAADYIKSLFLRLQKAYKIQDAKSLVCAERDRFRGQFSLESMPNSSRGNQSVTWHKLRMDPLIKKDEVVGLDRPKHILEGWLTYGEQGRTVISVVGIAGVGKTTLAKHVFDKVRSNFDCHALITVSQSYTVEELLRKMLSNLGNNKKEDPSMMDRMILIKKVQECLSNKRYVVFFDDAWNEEFWDEIESALIDDENKSRILITTRYEKVALCCRKSSFTQVYRLENPLSDEESFKLLCKKAFQYSSHGLCPEDLKSISYEIVSKCKGLPLAIVVVGGLLSQKEKKEAEWRQFSENLSLELGRNLELNGILSLSYDDLTYNLRSCLLYFGMYPEDYQVKSGRLIRQWVAEGFVKHETESGKTREKIAQEYLQELIARSLVQVSSFSIDGKVKGCRVHDSIHEMILRKMKDTGFCAYIDEHSPLVSGGVARRLTIATGSNDFVASIDRSLIRSIVIFTRKTLLEDYISGILAEYMPLKVLDFENAPVLYGVPEDLGNLIHLKYLSLRNAWVESIPKSIGKLQNLETLDVRRTAVSEIPTEISKLRKLRHLLGNRISSTALKDGLGGMQFLQKISILSIEGDDGEEVMKDLGKLKQLRDMRINISRERHINTLCSSVNELHLETVYIYAEATFEVIDLDFKSLSTFKKLFLDVKLKRLPNWIPRLQNLVKLSFKSSELTNDPLESLKDLPNLLFLYMGYRAYEGERLHFQDGGFQKLKELRLQSLEQLDSIIIGRGALRSLKKLDLTDIPKLKTVPDGIQHLEKLEVLDIWYMSIEFEGSIAPNGEQHWMIQHVPLVYIKR